MATCKTQFTPADWRRDPALIRTPHVEVWLPSGIMVTARCPRSEAQDAIRAGRAYVMTSQAIRLLEDCP